MTIFETFCFKHTAKYNLSLKRKLVNYLFLSVKFKNFDFVPTVYHFLNCKSCFTLVRTLVRHYITTTITLVFPVFKEWVCSRPDRFNLSMTQTSWSDIMWYMEPFPPVFTVSLAGLTAVPPCFYPQFPCWAREASVLPAPTTTMTDWFALLPRSLLWHLTFEISFPTLNTLKTRLETRYFLYFLLF